MKVLDSPPPTGATQIVRVSQADPNVDCALGIEAIGVGVAQGFMDKTAEGRETTIAGRPGQASARRIRVSLRKDADGDGTLYVFAYGRADQPKVEAVVTDILGKHFN